MLKIDGLVLATPYWEIIANFSKLKTLCGELPVKYHLPNYIEAGVAALAELPPERQADLVIEAFVKHAKEYGSDDKKFMELIDKLEKRLKFT